jgi:hypothetical protein
MKKFLVALIVVGLIVVAFTLAARNLDLANMVRVIHGH